VLSTIKTWKNALLFNGFSTEKVGPRKSPWRCASFDSKGQPLTGRSNYRLHVSANVPVSQFWALTVYSAETNALFFDLNHPTLDSLDTKLQRNTDGSVEIYFGSKTPLGHESNWIRIPAGKEFTPWFRFYGPVYGFEMTTEV
jgi:hypothetical protein